jgi:ATP-dependent RNA helicase DeaD
MNDIASLREPLGDALTDALLQKGYAALTSVQSRVLESAAETRDLRVSSQTGSGKTVALGIAVREFVLGHAAARKLGGHTGAAAPATLVITPTRELAHQVEGELTWLFAKVPARVASVTGGASYRDEKRNLAMGPSIVVGTPGRLLDHLKQGIIDASTSPKNIAPTWSRRPSRVKCSRSRTACKTTPSRSKAHRLAPRTPTSNT